MAVFNGARSTTDGLLVCLDAFNPKSYTAGTSTWRNLVKGSGAFGDFVANGSNYNTNSEGLQITNTNTDFRSELGYNFVSDPGIAMEVVYKVAVADNHDVYGRIIDWRDTTVSLGTYASEQFRCWVNAGGGRNTGEFAINSNEPGFYDSWNHAVLTYDKSNVKGYWNAVERFSVAKTGNLENGNSILTIGNGDGNYFGGRISFVRIYNRGLTADQVKINYDHLNLRYNFGN